MNTADTYMTLAEENELFLLRQAGEYEADEELSEEDALTSIAAAAEFIRQVEAHLRTSIP